MGFGLVLSPTVPMQSPFSPH